METVEPHIKMYTFSTEYILCTEVPQKNPRQNQNQKNN